MVIVIELKNWIFEMRNGIRMGWIAKNGLNWGITTLGNITNKWILRFSLFYLENMGFYDKCEPIVLSVL